jgi:hypothetical protein
MSARSIKTTVGAVKWFRFLPEDAGHGEPGFGKTKAAKARGGGIWAAAVGLDSCGKRHHHECRLCAFGWLGMPTLFISHSSSNDRWPNAPKHCLGSRGFSEVFIDHHSLHA